MEATTIEFSLWLLGMATAVIGIGYALYFQGAIWAKPEQQKSIGERALKRGRCLLFFGIVYGIVAIVLTVLSLIPLLLAL